jgi:acyl carrier protein
MNELIHLIKEALEIDFPFDVDTPLISSGVIDSFRMAALMTALESRYGTHIDLAQIGADNFDTVRQMTLFLRTHV